MSDEWQKIGDTPIKVSRPEDDSDLFVLIGLGNNIAEKRGAKTAARLLLSALFSVAVHHELDETPDVLRGLAEDYPRLVQAWKMLNSGGGSA